MPEIIQKTAIAILGGGQAGLAAAVPCGRSRFPTLLLDRNPQCGRKMLASGGGHCNFSHTGTVAELVEHFHGQGRFLYSALSKYGRDTYVRFLNGAGVQTIVDARGRLLPRSGRAADVCNAFIAAAERYRVDLRTRAQVTRVSGTSGRWRIDYLDNGTPAVTEAQSLIFATGTAAGPATGADPGGILLAAALGHQMVELSAALAPIEIREPWVGELAGVTLRDCGLLIRKKGGRAQATARGELLFTHSGLTGPLPLSLSRWIKAGDEQEVVLDFLPAQNQEQVILALTDGVAAHPRRSLRNLLRTLIPESLAAALLQVAGLPATVTGNETGKKACRRVAALLKQCVLHSTGPLPPESGMTCRGGIALSEVDPRTMMSKQSAGLFFAGDMLDIDGFSGGYNLQAAFSTGMLAGESAVAWLESQSSF
jgi:predicted Rossmann fold flavoprotein